MAVSTVNETAHTARVNIWLPIPVLEKLESKSQEVGIRRTQLIIMILEKVVGNNGKE